MLRRSLSSARPAGTTAITALLLIPLLALVAFAVDLNHIWRTDEELQSAADAAAQAGATALMSFTVQATQPGRTQSERQAALEATLAAVTARAVAFGQMHTAGDVKVVINASDI